MPKPDEGLSATVAQFSILIPYPGTVLNEALMEWLFLKTNSLYSTPSKKAVQDVWWVIKRHKLGLRTVFI